MTPRCSGPTLPSRPSTSGRSEVRAQELGVRRVLLRGEEPAPVPEQWWGRGKVDEGQWCPRGWCSLLLPTYSDAPEQNVSQWRDVVVLSLLVTLLSLSPQPCEITGSSWRGPHPTS